MSSERGFNLATVRTEIIITVFANDAKCVFNVEVCDVVMYYRGVRENRL